MRSFGALRNGFAVRSLRSWNQTSLSGMSELPCMKSTFRLGERRDYERRERRMEVKRGDNDEEAVLLVPSDTYVFRFLVK